MLCSFVSGAALFGPFGSVAFFLVLCPCPCSFGRSCWVCCVLCVFCVCFVTVCAEFTCLERLPSPLLLCGFGISPLGRFVLLLCLYLRWCCFYTCPHLFADLCCSDSCWRLFFLGLGGSTLLLAPVRAFVLFVPLPAPVPLLLVFALLLLAELAPLLLVPLSDLCLSLRWVPTCGRPKLSLCAWRHCKT